MNSEQAKQMLNEELEKYRQQTFAELANRIGENEANEKTSASGARYQIEINIFWENQPNGNILVIGSIDDGGWRAFAPLTMSFLKRRDAAETV